jgi:hypothetical protein
MGYVLSCIHMTERRSWYLGAIRKYQAVLYTIPAN